MKKDLKVLNDLLNKYKSELSTLTTKKLSKVVNEEKIMWTKLLINNLKNAIDNIKIINTK